MSKPLTDLELASNLGISITELLHRRDEYRRQVVNPAVEAYRKVLAASLMPSKRKRFLQRLKSEPVETRASPTT